MTDPKTDLNSTKLIDELPENIRRLLEPMIQEVVQRICTQVQYLDVESQLQVARVLKAAAYSPDGATLMKVGGLSGMFPWDESQGEFEEFVMDD